MSISQTDIKILWGKAASRCAFPDCRIELTQNSHITSNSILIGEQAHIVDKESNGPRGESLLTSKERDSYDNLILLCPTHHTLIDKSKKDFPVEKLHSIKTKHELWVQQTLSQRWDLNQQASDLIYTSLIDSAVEYCHLRTWKEWTCGPLSPIPTWPYNLPNDFLKFRLKVLSSDWPGTLPELERSIKTLSIVLHNAASIFEQHCHIEKDGKGNLYLQGDQFYKIPEWNKEKYKQLGQEFDIWVEACHQLIINATKAANWFREVVRKDINPMFFATEGKFIATSPWSAELGLSHTYLVPEFTQAEKDRRPDCLHED